MWGRNEFARDESPRVAMLRDEADAVRRERRQVNAFLLVAIALVGWYFQDGTFAPLPLFILLGVTLLCAIHHQLCGIRLDALYREIREQSPDLWRAS